MGIKEKIAEAEKNGTTYVVKDMSEFVTTLPDGRNVLEIFTNGPVKEINAKTSRVIGVGRGEAAVLLKPLKYVLRDGPKGGMTKRGTYKAGEKINIFGWPGFTDKNHCDLIVLHGEDDIPPGENAREEIEKRAIQCKDGHYINLIEGVDYEYTTFMVSSEKTTEMAVTCRDIDFMDQYYCEGTVPAMTAVSLCTQYGETFLEFEGNTILENPVEGVDYF